MSREELLHEHTMLDLYIAEVILLSVRYTTHHGVGIVKFIIIISQC